MLHAPQIGYNIGCVVWVMTWGNRFCNNAGVTDWVMTQWV